MKEKMQLVWSKIKLFWRELGNFLTNIACPILSIVAAVVEVCQLPAGVAQAIKKAEYWCWYACGTKEKIDAVIEQSKKKEKVETEDQSED